MRYLPRILVTAMLVSLVALAGCATWTQAQWDDLAASLRAFNAATHAARQQQELERMQQEITALQLHQAMQPPFPFGR